MPAKRLLGLGLVFGLGLGSFGLLRLLGFLVLVVALGLLGLGDGRAQDIAQAGAGIGGAEFLQRLFVFFDFAGLDRQVQLAGLGVDHRDLGIQLVADGKTIRALFAALPGKLGLADEADGAIGQRHLDAALVDGGDAHRHNIALPVGCCG